VLDKVAGLPVTRWTFKEMPGQKHLGSMAQDFHAAFRLGAGKPASPPWMKAAWRWRRSRD
jgi:hypothetical protein